MNWLLYIYRCHTNIDFSFLRTDVRTDTHTHGWTGSGTGVETDRFGEEGGEREKDA